MKTSFLSLVLGFGLSFYGVDAVCAAGGRNLCTSNLLLARGGFQLAKTVEPGTERPLWMLKGTLFPLPKNPAQPFIHLFGDRPTEGAVVDFVEQLLDSFPGSPYQIEPKELRGELRSMTVHHVREAFSEALSNALKHGHNDNGVPIRYQVLCMRSTRDPRVAILKIQIRDYGSGIQDNTAHVHDPDAADPTAHSEARSTMDILGSGFGLALQQGRTHSYKVVSQPNVGTLVTMGWKLIPTGTE